MKYCHHGIIYDLVLKTWQSEKKVATNQQLKKSFLSEYWRTNREVGSSDNIDSSEGDKDKARG